MKEEVIILQERLEYMFQLYNYILNRTNNLGYNSIGTNNFGYKINSNIYNLYFYNNNKIYDIINKIIL